MIPRKLTEENNLAVTHPHLLREWDYEKNTINPNQITKGSEKKIWWKCKNGHSWEAFLFNRSREKLPLGCPYCSNKKACNDNNLALKFPHLLDEWDYQKNINVSPEDCLPGSKIKVWWKCNKGHSWETRIDHRTSSQSGCPFCCFQTSKAELRLFCELNFIFPDALWSESINRVLCDIYIPSHKVVIEYDGSYWHGDKVNQDYKKGVGLGAEGITVFRLRECGLVPIDPAHDVVIQKDENLLSAIKRLTTLLKEILTLSPEETSRSNQYLMVRGFINEDMYNKYSPLLNIPKYENSIAAHPLLVAEWNYDKNKYCKPDMLSVGSDEKVWWKCHLGHEWETRVYHRKKGTGCPYCAGKKPSPENNLASQFPNLVKEWDTKRNNGFLPSEITCGSGKKVWWICAEGHRWSAVVVSRTKSKCGCPECWKNKRTHKEGMI